MILILCLPMIKFMQFHFRFTLIEIFLRRRKSFIGTVTMLGVEMFILINY